MKNKTTIIVSVALIIIIAAVFVIFRQNGQNQTPSTTTDGIASSGTVLAKNYTSAKHNFSFSYREGMNARDITTDTFDVVVIEGPLGTDGFQVVISPFSGEALQASNVGELLQGTSATDARDLTVGYTGKGFIFRSNNPSFEGGSIEAWFAKDGKLFQATTYVRNEALLLDSLATWKFSD